MIAQDVRNRSLVCDIVEWIDARGLRDDIAIYFNGNALATWNEWGGENGKEVLKGWYYYENRNPRDYFMYCNPDTVSVSFEGTLNHYMNGYLNGWVEIYESFIDLPKPYGMFFEMGDSWNVSAYMV